MGLENRATNRLLLDLFARGAIHCVVISGRGASSRASRGALWSLVARAWAADIPVLVASPLGSPLAALGRRAAGSLAGFSKISLRVHDDKIRELWEVFRFRVPAIMPPVRPAKSLLNAWMSDTLLRAASQRASGEVNNILAARPVRELGGLGVETESGVQSASRIACAPLVPDRIFEAPSSIGLEKKATLPCFTGLLHAPPLRSTGALHGGNHPP